MKRYYTNGSLTDSKYTGVTLAVFDQNEDGTWALVQRSADGEPYFGYLAKEITKEEFDVWSERINSPDKIDYFPGIFKNGVLDKTTYDTMVAEVNIAKTANLSVTRVQALVTLAQNGITKDGIYAALETLPNADVAKVWFDESATFKRSNVYVKAMVNALGMTDEQADSLFLEASRV